MIVDKGFFVKVETSLFFFFSIRWYCLMKILYEDNNQVELKRSARVWFSWKDKVGPSFLRLFCVCPLLKRRNKWVCFCWRKWKWTTFLFSFKFLIKLLTEYIGNPLHKFYVKLMPSRFLFDDWIVYNLYSHESTFFKKEKNSHWGWA